MAITLFFFIMGSVIATHHIGFWHDLPRFQPYSFVKHLGAPTAIALFVGILGTLYDPASVLRTPDLADTF